MTVADLFHRIGDMPAWWLFVCIVCYCWAPLIALLASSLFSVLFGLVCYFFSGAYTLGKGLPDDEL